MRPAAAAYRMQLGLALRTPNLWMGMLTTPAQTVLFLSVIRSFDRPDLLAHALIAPALITLWGSAVWTGGSVVRDDRWQGRLELHAAAPTSYGLIVPMRVAAVMTLALSVIPLALATAWLTYGVTVQVRHPWLLVALLVLVVGAATGTAAIITSMTILTRAANTLQSSASYPFLLLGGVFVPLAMLPVWAQPLGRAVFLSWGSDLIRDSVTAPEVTGLPGRAAALAALGVAGFLVADRLIRVVLHRVRVSGEISSA